MLIRFNICSLCFLTYCNFSYFPLWFSGRDFGSDCISSWSLLIFYFSNTLNSVSQITRIKLIFIVMQNNYHGFNKLNYVCVFTDRFNAVLMLWFSVLLVLVSVSLLLLHPLCLDHI